MNNPPPRNPILSHYQAQAEIAQLTVERDALLAEVATLRCALERSLNWLASYPGDACMGEKGPYNQARAALGAP